MNASPFITVGFNEMRPGGNLDVFGLEPGYPRYRVVAPSGWTRAKLFGQDGGAAVEMTEHPDDPKAPWASARLMAIVTEHFRSREVHVRGERPSSDLTSRKEALATFVRDALAGLEVAS